MRKIIFLGVILIIQLSLMPTAIIELSNKVEDNKLSVEAYSLLIYLFVFIFIITAVSILARVIVNLINEKRNGLDDIE